MKAFFIKPPPPPELLSGLCPVAEEPRYDWEPLGLELLALRLRRVFGAALDCELWHLRGAGDEAALAEACRSFPPDLAVFGELDVYLSSASRIALALKRAAPGCVTVAGGKHASLLAPGDAIPHRGMDYIIAGCGVEPLEVLCAGLLAGRRPDSLPGLVEAGPDGRVRRISGKAAWDGLEGIDGRELRDIPLMTFERGEYYSIHQRFPSPAPLPQRTASVLWSTGCRHSCGFCQSPAERRGVAGPACRQRPPGDIAREILWLARHEGVNSIFAVAPNLDLDSVEAVYRILKSEGAGRIPVAGFVRAADVAAAGRSGLLGRLSALGLGTLSVGWDLSPASGADPHRKGYGRETEEECLRACLEAGVPLAITVLGDTSLDAGAFERSLEAAVELPVLSVDVRLATAFRGTEFWNRNRAALVRDPDRFPEALDRNNYRYVTVSPPGSLEPEQAYAAIGRFRTAFAATPARERYALDLLSARPGLAPLFAPASARQGRSGPLRGEAAELWDRLFMDGETAAGPAPDCPAPAQPCVKLRRAGSDYDPLAAAYDRAFGDIRVRWREWRWVEAAMKELAASLGRKPRVLDIGCGTGALLRALRPLAADTAGTDPSAGMLGRARAADCLDLAAPGATGPAARFVRTEGHALPFPDDSFDLVMSFLSWRYLDWRRLPPEISRVLAPGGVFLCVEIAAAPAGLRDYPRVFLDGLRDRRESSRHPGFRRALTSLVSRPEWREMHGANPPRSLQAIASCASGTFGTELQTLGMGSRARVVAFKASAGSGGWGDGTGVRGASP